MINDKVLQNFRSQVEIAIQNGRALPIKENEFLTPNGTTKSYTHYGKALTPELIDEIIAAVDALPATLPDFANSEIFNVGVETMRDGVLVTVDFRVDGLAPREFHSVIQRWSAFYVERWALGYDVTIKQRTMRYGECVTSPREYVYRDADTIEDAFKALNITVSVMSDDEDESHEWVPIEFQVLKTATGFRAACLVFLHDTAGDAE